MKPTQPTANVAGERDAGSRLGEHDVQNETASNGADLPAEAQDAAAHPAACENCATPLQGEYCHACGQSSHNPLRHVGHAIEEVFESFWHLDGRIFRTLRLLFVPGRVAREYLAGHRVRFIPPLRLFVILSLLTFFVGKMVLHVGDGVRVEGLETEMRSAQTVAEVERIRERLLEPIEEAEREAANVPGVNPALVAARVRIQGEASARIAELRERAAARPAAADAQGANATEGAQGTQDTENAKKDAQGATDAKDAKGKSAPPPADDATGTTNDTSAATDAASGTAEVTVAPLALDEDDASFMCRFNDHGFDPVANPVRVRWLPGFAERWLNGRIARACENLKYADRNGERLFQQFLGAIPTALFLLMPIFALLLKTLYLGSGRSYLEHLVVALYSHCYLLLMLLLMFVLSAASNAGAPAWLTGLGYAAAWIWMPVYLWLMQRRVYGGGWFSNFARYLVIGTIYFMLVTFATVYAGLVGISS